MNLLRPKFIRNVLLFTLVMLPLFGSTASQPTKTDIPDISKRINAFTFDLLKHSAQSGVAADNIVLSPQSIFQGLAMSYVASGGETRKELAGVLHFPEDNQALVESLSNLRQQLDAAAKHEGIEVTVANSAWLDETHATFRKEYVDEAQKAFDASLHTVKFKNRDQVSDEINQWVSEMTHGRIQEVVGPEDFKSKSIPSLDVIDEPALVLVNAVYFKADWGSRFEKKGTRQYPFHVDAATTENALMMHQRSLLPYSENEQVQFLEIPYIEDGYSMYVILPKQVLKVGELMNLLTPDMIADLKRSAYGYNVDVLLPKFEMKSRLGVKDALAAMGVKSAFDNHKADFDKMIVKTREAFRIYISQISHEARIDVHEEGTEAAAATATGNYSFGCGMSGTPQPTDFHADHPFLFLIVHNESRSILFAGWISRPKELAQQVRPPDK